MRNRRRRKFELAWLAVCHLDINIVYKYLQRNFCREERIGGFT